jgi:mediator of replication checkpoint protein 1
MSPPSTPSRASTASSSSSPLPTNSASPMELTPRSKVKALLAAFDDDSEDEITAQPITNHVRPEIMATKELGGLGSALPDFDVEFEDEDAVPTAQAIAQKSSADTGMNIEDNDASGSSAYARMKQQLLSNPKSLQTKLAPLVQSESDSDDEEPIPTKKAARKSITFAQSTIESDDDEPVLTKKPARKTLTRPLRMESKSPTSASPRSRQASTSLFVSPAVSPSSRSLADKNTSASNSDSDELPDSVMNPRLQELVAKKRAERQAQAEAARKRASEIRMAEKKKQAELQKSFKEIYSSEMDDGMGEDDLKALTQQSKPTRKASRKAMEEMNRETQRMARNQQLAHQAKTKKKITTKDLFKVFNFMQDDVSEDKASSHTDDEHSKTDALASSDVEGHTGKDTPPTSPPRQEDYNDQFKIPVPIENEDEYIIRTGVHHQSDNDELQTLKEVFAKPQPPRKDKGKGRATEPDVLPLTKSTDKGKPKGPPKKFRVIPPTKLDDTDSDDDLEIVTTKQSSRFAVFDQVPANKANKDQSFHALRTLAHLNSSERAPPKGRASLSMGELQMQLQERARKQALLEKQEKMDELRARGIVIQTDEEREQDQLALESLLEKARSDAQTLAKKEKDAAKKEGNEGESKDLLSDDEEEDGDWAEDEQDDVDVELSGSEEEDIEETEDIADAGEEGVLIDNEAGEDEDEDEQEGADHLDDIDDVVDHSADEDEDISNMPTRNISKSRARNVIVDEEDEDRIPPPLTELETSQNDTMAAFGFHAPQTTELGLTQLFKGTMTDIDSQQDSLAFLRTLPAPSIPGLDFSMTQDSQSQRVQDSQSNLTDNEETQFSFGLNQFPSQLDSGSALSPTRFSEVPEPTQDAGFESFRAPVGVVNVPHSTVDTVIASIPESPLLKKKGKLRRGNHAIAVLSDAEDASDEEEFELSTNAFDVLFKATKKAPTAEAFDKQRSEAKKMVEEQAEESEDEYAGLGGASDDESNGEMDEEMKKMIDEEPVHVNEGELAKFYADKERADDEKRIDKLYKDVTTGMLRRKRGADLDDLSDSDDEAEERRRRKQREFAKMRKALLEDENIGKIGKVA